jgi:hypothetical protein
MRMLEHFKHERAVVKVDFLGPIPGETVATTAIESTGEVEQRRAQTGELDPSAQPWSVGYLTFGASIQRFS